MFQRARNRESRKGKEGGRNVSRHECVKADSGGQLAKAFKVNETNKRLKWAANARLTFLSAVLTTAARPLAINRSENVGTMRTAADALQSAEN